MSVVLLDYTIAEQLYYTKEGVTLGGKVWRTSIVNEDCLSL
jgi:hypothetical protein